MSNEYLLKPRYKVIAPWPGMGEDIKVGQILTLDGECTDVDEFKNFPNLFRRLHWAEYREPGDMPEYVKHGENGMPRKVQNYNMIHGYVIFEGGRQRNIFKGWIPCTAAEYESYQSKKQNI